MIGNALRRFYVFGLMAVACFLFGTVLFDLGEMNIATFADDAASGVLTFIGIILVFKAFESLSNQDDYDRPEKRYAATPYTIAFYILAIAMVLATVFLLVWILQSRMPDLGEGLLLFWGSVVAVVSVFIGRRSRSEK